MKVFPLLATLLLALEDMDANCRAGAQNLPAKFKAVPISASVTGAAATSHIPLTGIDSPLSTSVLHPGDSVTILGTMFTKKSESQWLLYIEGENPGNNKTNPPPMVVHLHNRKISFPSKPIPARLRTLGPFAASDGARFKFRERTAQLTLNEGLLSLGLDRAADIIWRRNQTTNTTIFAADPPPIEAIKVQKREARKELTPEEEEAMAGAISTVTSYLEIVKHTEGLEDLLSKLIKLPSMWSVVRHLGVTVSLYFGDSAFPANPTDWDLPRGTPVYYVPCSLRLNDQPALKITVVVTRPSPPRLICGGIVGLLAEKIGDNDIYMTLRVVSAKCKPQE